MLEQDARTRIEVSHQSQPGGRGADGVYRQIGAVLPEQHDEPPYVPAPEGVTAIALGRLPVQREAIVNQYRRIPGAIALEVGDRKSTRLNSSHLGISYAVF